MYGLLKPASKFLSCEERKVYSQYYCGQCAALHDNFGYLSRIATSYDAAFFGLLIAAQQDEPEKIEKRWCAMAPIKKKVCSSTAPATQVSAALALTFAGMKIRDKQQENNSQFLTRVDRFLSPAMSKAGNILCSHGISADLIGEALAKQQSVEEERADNVLAYAEPTSRLIGQFMRATAVIAGRHDNSEILAQIGHALGRIIYLVDACVDLSDDIAKKEFNALLVSYAAEDGELKHETGDQVTSFIIESLRDVRALLSKQKLKRYQNIVSNILTVGLSLTIRQQITRSINRLEEYQPTLLKYAPHAALATAVCIFLNETAEAGWIAGKMKDSQYGACGYTFGHWENDNIHGEALLNPFAYFYPRECSGKDNCCCDACCHTIDNILGAACIVVCQLPKAFLTYWIPRKIIPEVRGAQKQAKENRIVREKERQRLAEEKRRQDNAAFIDSSTKEIKKYEQVIKSSSIADLELTFDKRIQKIIDKATNADQNIKYASSREIADGIMKLTTEAANLSKAFQSVDETQDKIKQAFSTVRNLHKMQNEQMEAQMRLYEELLGPKELQSLIQDQRFEDYSAIAVRILNEVSCLAK